MFKIILCAANVFLCLSLASSISAEPTPFTDDFASTYLGGSGEDGEYGGFDMVVDGMGNVYMTSFTTSSDFPATPGAYNENYNGGASDLFVVKLSCDMKTLLASTYLGGSGDECYPSIVLDGQGNVCLAAASSSKDFPTVPGSFDETYNGGKYDYIVAKLDKDLTTLLAATYVGGYGQEGPYYSGIALSSEGDLFLTGDTRSYNFPTSANAYDKSFNGSSDAVIFRLDSGLQTLLSSTYVGGNDDENFLKIVVDLNDNVFISGSTESTNYPVTSGAYQTFYAGGYYDNFISKLDKELTTLSASTFVGGSHELGEACFDIDADEMGNIFICGHATPGYPSTPGAYDPDHNGDNEGYISKFTNDLSVLLASTFMSGPGTSGCVCGNVAYDEDGYVISTGYTWCPDFPTTPDAFDRTFNGGFFDAIIVRLDSDLTELTAASFIGGKGDDTAVAADMDGNGKLFMTGITDSVNYPVSNGAFQPIFHGGDQDAFITMLSDDLSAEPFLSTDVAAISELTGGTVNFMLTAGGNHGNRDYLVLSGVSGTSPGTPLPGGYETLPLNWDLFTNSALLWLNTTFFSDFFGKLDSEGNGLAQLNSPPIPGYAGLEIFFAYMLNSPYDFASNPVIIEITN